MHQRKGNFSNYLAPEAVVLQDVVGVDTTGKLLHSGDLDASAIEALYLEGTQRGRVSVLVVSREFHESQSDFSVETYGAAAKMFVTFHSKYPVIQVFDDLEIDDLPPTRHFLGSLSIVSCVPHEVIETFIPDLLAISA